MAGFGGKPLPRRSGRCPLAELSAPLFDDWDDFLMAVGSFGPVRLKADTSHITCDDGTTRRFDAHLDDTKVPILYVGAAGGFGTYGCTRWT